MGTQGRKSGQRRAIAARVGAAAALCGVVAACGGRPAQPVAAVRQIDVALTCEHISAEQKANEARAADLRDERVDNRIRTLSRLPGAIIGNPFTAIALADPSIAIYRELNALETRNDRLTAMRTERACDAPAEDAATIVAEASGAGGDIGPALPEEAVIETAAADAADPAIADGGDQDARADAGSGADAAAAALAAAVLGAEDDGGAPSATTTLSDPAGASGLADAPWAAGAQALGATSVSAEAPAPPQRPTTPEIIEIDAENVGPAAEDAPPPAAEATEG